MFDTIFCFDNIIMGSPKIRHKIYKNPGDIFLFSFCSKHAFE